MKYGFKMIVRREWLDETLNQILLGKSEKEIRAFLDEYISTQKQSGGICAKRNKATYGMSLTMLSSWFRKDEELLPMQKRLLSIAKVKDQQEWLPLHFAMISTAYPIFLLVCEQVGKLLSLSNEITSNQIYSQMKDLLGDTDTIARNTRYAIRTLVSWDLIKDSTKKGFYIKGASFEIYDDFEVALLYEAVLRGLPNQKSEFNELLQSRSLFGFKLESISATTMSCLCKPYVEATQYNLTNEYVEIKKIKDEA